MFRFKCAECDAWHVGVPSLDANEPMPVTVMTEVERASRCFESSDAFVVDGTDFYVRGCLEIPVHGLSEHLTWGVWVSLSEASFTTFLDSYEMPKRSHLGPFFGWLATGLPYGVPTIALKTHVHLRDDGIRPLIEVEPTDHPLAVQQRDGITVEQLGRIYARSIHGPDPG